MQIYQRFKEVRKSLKMTQEEFGKELGRTKMAISYYEKGERSIDSAVIKLLQERFNINSDWLVNGTGDMILNNDNNNNYIDDERINTLSITYNLPQRFLKLALQLNKNELERIEGYMEAVIENRKIYEKDMQRLSS